VDHGWPNSKACVERRAAVVGEVGMGSPTASALDSMADL
jgi:hypothetical protein